MTKQLFSISTTITQYIVDRDIESGGYIQIYIENLMPANPDHFNDREKLSLVGQRMAEDLYQFVSSYDDVYFEGEHYVPYAAV